MSKRTKNYYITNRIYQFLKENPDYLCFKKYRGNIEGMYEPDTNMICVDPRKDIVPTLIHELLHHWHPDWCETAVEKETQHIVSNLTIDQIKNIIRRIAYAI